MAEIYRKDRPTDILKNRGNQTQLKNVYALGLPDTIQEVIMPNFSPFPREMAEIYKKDRQTDIVKY